MDTSGSKMLWKLEGQTVAGLSAWQRGWEKVWGSRLIALAVVPQVSRVYMRWEGGNGVQRARYY